MKKTHKLSQGDVAEIKDAWVNGENGEPVTLQALADDYDVTKHGIRYHVKGLEQKIKARRGGKPTFDHDRARALRGQGLTGYVVAERLGVTAPTIYRLMKHGASNGRVAKRSPA